MKNPWKKVSSKEVYKNPWIRVREDQVIRPDGNPGIYGVVELRGKSVGVIPIDKDGNIYLVGQHRYIFDEYSWEIPTGSANENENPEDAVKRELKEETGLIANKLIPLAVIWPSDGITNEEFYLFLAEDLVQSKAAPDETEDIKVKKIPLSEAIKLVEDGKIKDAASIIAIQKFQLMKS